MRDVVRKQLLRKVRARFVEIDNRVTPIIRYRRATTDDPSYGKPRGGGQGERGTPFEATVGRIHFVVGVVDCFRKDAIWHTLG